MKYITIILLFLCLMSCHNGRQSSCENVPVEKDSVQLRVIPVSISDTASQCRPDFRTNLVCGIVGQCCNRRNSSYSCF